MPALRVRARFALGLPLIAAVACGSPGFTYVKNSDAGMYLKIPRAWDAIDTEVLQNEVSGDASTTTGKLARAHAWHAAFDAAVPPSVKHVFSPGPADPVAWTFVRDLGPTERLALSLNTMRDLVLPVGEVAATPGAAAAGFELVSDVEIHPHQGLYGRHTVFHYKVDGTLQTVDQTVITNDRHTKVYYLVVRCTKKCFDSRHDEIATVVNSFTVRG